MRKVSLTATVMVLIWIDRSPEIEMVAPPPLLVAEKPARSMRAAMPSRVMTK